ncbi:MAG TPA: BTAD domain-containing putative transcriptional regulator, partial [Nonomuraea sp.]|nr:BTAD domain-containing putative transcriptional regulator [Nonomuraea sp.]
MTHAAPGRHRVRFSVLGTMEVSTRGNAVPLRAPLQRRLLASLLCRAGRPVASSTLIEAVWGRTPPPSARKTMQVYLSRLRHAIGNDGWIAHDGTGYVAVVGSQELDALRFAELGAEGRQAKTRGDLRAADLLLGEALGLWRGPAYADTSDVRFVADEAQRLEDMHLTAQEELAAIRLGLGRFSQVVIDLSEPVAAHPYRERLHACLMIALSRSGRQAEALELYGRTRATLHDDLGVEPGPLLRRVHEAILRDGGGDALIREVLEIAGEEPERARPEWSAERPVGASERRPVTIALRPARAATPSELPPDIADLTGRQDLLARLHHRFTSRHPAEPTMIAALSGGPGTGKTTLAVHLAHQVRAAYPDGQLFADLQGSRPRPADPADVLARLLSALGEHAP